MSPVVSDQAGFVGVEEELEVLAGLPEGVRLHGWSPVCLVAYIVAVVIVYAWLW
jgi:hypothetical protein